jgi:hypothetical protein
MEDPIATDTAAPLVVTIDPQTPLPKKNTLSTGDWEKWMQETIIYNLIPVGLVILQTLQAAYMTHGGLPNGNDLTLAAGASYGALIAAGINILGKYKSGI